MDAPNELRGCTRCEPLRTERDEEVGLERIADELPFAAPVVEGVDVLYDHSWLSRCPECGVYWLSQFWEEFDDVLDENGSRRWVSYPVPNEAVEEVAEAKRSGMLLPHDRYR